MKGQAEAAGFGTAEMLGAVGVECDGGGAVSGVNRKQLSALANKQAGISPEMAILLDKAFGGGAGVSGRWGLYGADEG